MRGNEKREENLKTIEIAKEYLNKGVCAVDLAGAEALFPTENFEDIFKLAEQLEIPFTIHAGEAAGAESIKKALQFGAKRIGHGIRCLEDESLVKVLIEKGITLEICPTSNFQTKAVEGEYPLEKIYRRGIMASISPDNNTVSNTNIIEEYKWILENTGLTIDDLKQMNINAIRGAFISVQEKAKLIGQIKMNEENKDKNRI